MSVELFHTVVFYAFGGLALAASIVMVAQRNPAYSAFALIVTLVALAGVFGLLGSPFLAVLQVVVYAGAIMVLFLFVLMLLNVRRETPRQGESPALKLIALALGALLAGEVGAVLVRAERPTVAGFYASATDIAQLLFAQHYLYVFEATSILILAALVGAVALAKRDARP